METDPDQRYPSARAVAATLTGFALWLPTTLSNLTSQANPATGENKRESVLVVDDDEGVRALMTQLLKDRYEVRQAVDAEEAFNDLNRNPPELVVVDVNLPGLSGPEFIAKVRAAGFDQQRLKVILMSGNMPDEVLGGLSVSGADDFLSKPFKAAEFVSRVRALMLRRGPQPGKTLCGNPTLRITTSATVRQASPSTPAVRESAPAEALSLTVSRLLIETSLAAEGQWGRVVRYVRALAGAVTDQGEYSRLKDDAYLDLLAAVAPVYDIGLLAVPRGLLMKADKLDPEEQAILQTHTTVGSEVLMTVAGKLAAELPSLPLAAEVARSHHERWDGNGYPDQLKGNEIPLAARVVAVAGVYEALRVRRPHRPPLSHAQAVKTITVELPGQFDPILVAAFAATANRFERIHQGD